MVAMFATAAGAQPPEYLLPTPQDRAAQLKNDRWLDTIAREIPRLKNDRDDRLPMILWHGVGFDPLSESEIAILGERGLCQHLQLSEAMIPAALSLQRAGMPVILMEGRTDSWPYSLAENPDDWAHQFEAGFPQPWFGKDDAFEWHGACLHKTAGWALMEQQTRTTLQKFRDAGVTVDAVWMDFEGDPYPWSHLFDQLQNCRRCRAELPPEIVNSKERWRDYCWQLYVRLYDQHFAKAVRDVFPDCLVTNWHVVRSTTENPVRYFVGQAFLPELRFQYFNATNPIAYASDSVWFERSTDKENASRQSVDQFFLHQMLQQVSTDALNRQGSHIRCVPWVARVCKLQSRPESPAPVMSRRMYREALRHLWLRGVDAMQIFNPLIEGHEEAALEEIVDAAGVYDEMLIDRRLLGDGEVMNFSLPDAGSPGIVWSGLRNRQQAVVRVVSPTDEVSTISIECWPDQYETLEATGAGKTFRIRRRD